MRKVLARIYSEIGMIDHFIDCVCSCACIGVSTMKDIIRQAEFGNEYYLFP